MTRVVGSLVGPVVVVLMLGASGGGDDGAAETRAERIVLRKRDLPTGWRAQQDDEDDPSAQFDPDDLSECEFVGPGDYSDLEPKGSAESPSFESGDEFQFASGTAHVFGTTADARDVFDAFAGGCLTELLAGSFEQAEPTDESEVGDVDVEPLPAPDLGDEAEAGRVTTAIRFSEGGSLDLTFDSVMIRGGRAVAFLLTGALGSQLPGAERDRVAERVARRMR
ncbi:MAG: hypothetical protein ACRDY6_16470 [Acidimicrobiia bacterium]